MCFFCPKREKSAKNPSKMSISREKIGGNELGITIPNSTNRRHSLKNHRGTTTRTRRMLILKTTHPFFLSSRLAKFWSIFGTFSRFFWNFLPFFDNFGKKTGENNRKLAKKRKKRSKNDQKSTKILSHGEKKTQKKTLFVLNLPLAVRGRESSKG